MKNFVWATVVVGVLFVASCAMWALAAAATPSAEEMDRRRVIHTVRANAWLDRMHRPFVGLECHPGAVVWRCDVTPEVGQPFTLTCGEWCSLAVCQP